MKPLDKLLMEKLTFGLAGKQPPMPNMGSREKVRTDGNRQWHIYSYFLLLLLSIFFTEDLRAQTPITLCGSDSYSVALPGTAADYNADSIHWYRNSVEITSTSMVSADKLSLTVTAADLIGIDTFKVSFSGPAPDVCTAWGCNVVFSPACFDLALTKVLSRAGPFTVGDTVTFLVNVFNQGNVDAYRIGLTDYIPAGLTLTDADWTNVGGNATLNTPIATLAAGASTFVPITFTIDNNFVGTSITNKAEISAADNDTNTGNTPPTDIDSSPDASDGDPFGGDDITNNTGGDEDDHDIAVLPISRFDLALYKTLSPGQLTNVNPGDTVSFRITVINQGTIAASNIQIADYVPTNMAFITQTGWSVAGNLATTTLSSVLAPGDSTSVTIRLRVNAPLTAGTVVENWAEIQAATDAGGVVRTDIDSTPDSNPSNDTHLVDNAIDGNGKQGGDEDDHDPAYVIINGFDLALYKTLDASQSANVSPGDTVLFRITVVNQGSMAASNITITDYIPSDMSFFTQSGWTLSGATATTTLPTTLAIGDSTSVTIRLRVNAPLAAGTTVRNWAEISSATDSNGTVQTDIDSTPDGTQSNDTYLVDNSISGNGKQGGDEDDHDQAAVTVNGFDLALYKRLADGQSSQIQPGDDVRFTIVVVNQGSVPASNIQIKDYIPTEMTFSTASTALGWTGDIACVGDPQVCYESALQTYTGVLMPGDSTKLDIVLTTRTPLQSGITLTNWAEIAAATDNNGNQQTDIDSDPDGIQSNDRYLTDNDINGNGQAGGDEDDHDAATVTTMTFDLALVKRLAPNQSASVAPGETVNFVITVINQGQITATNIEVTDSIPTGMTFATQAGWTLSNGKAVATIAGPLQPGDSTSVNLSLSVDAPMAANVTIRNWAEISNAADNNGNAQTDYDSTPDSNLGNDNFLADNYIDGNGKQNGDEDDHDPAEVTTKAFDLALTKQLAPGQTANVAPGDTVNFRITVINQGEIAADNITVTDHIPTGLSLVDAAWTSVDANTATRVLSVTNGLLPTGGLAPNTSAYVDVQLRVASPLPVNTQLRNVAEISAATDTNNNPQTDVDSTPDGNANNDTALEDDEIAGNGNGGEDEDDHDWAIINTTQFDLALYKVLATVQAATVRPGDLINYTINVVNQGSIAADNITVTDYIPSNMTLDDANWTAAGTNATRVLSVANGSLSAGGLAPGQTTSVNISLRLSTTVPMGTDVRNFAEISAATDNNGNPQTDNDSTPDSDGTNDTVLQNDAINGNGLNGGDEDDHDYADVTVLRFDLALAKTLAPNQSATVTPGDTVTYRITVYNQGTIPADSIVVADYIPTGMSFVQQGGWALSGTTATRLLNIGDELVTALQPGQTTFVDIDLRVNAPAPAASSLTNWAEIASARDDRGNNLSDDDSTPDTDPANDTYAIDNNVNSDAATDEDDHDPATITLMGFDLALYKQLAPGESTSIAPGDDVTFRIFVINQGPVAADNIEVTDYIPTGMSLQDANWTASGTNATRTLTVANGTLPAGGLAPGQTTYVDITLRVPNPLPTASRLVNWAEISNATDTQGNPQQDEDSTPDTNQANDSFLIDDYVGGDAINGGDDEDDHDMAYVMYEVFDLALKKFTTHTTPVRIGDDVTFTIRVYNQGVIAARNITVRDYLPAGLILSPNDLNSWAYAGAQNLIEKTTGNAIINAGDSLDLQVTVRVQSFNTVQDLRNVAEITHAEDTQGTPRQDIDSTPDQNPTNDTVIDDVVDQSGTNGGDEDDHDIAFLNVLDLALRKTTDQTTPIRVGQDVRWTITVFNQGNVIVENVQITDYLPTGFSISATQSLGWTMVNGKATTTIPGLLVPGDSLKVDLYTTVDASAVNGNFINAAEISNIRDPYYIDITDRDIDSDADTNNDDTVVDNEINNGGNDEDDHDIAKVEIFDLAIRKTRNGNTAVAAGDDVAFTISVFNQSTTLSASNIEVIDYIPTGFTLSPNDTNGWTAGSGNTVTRFIASTLAPGQSADITILLRAGSSLAAGTHYNYTEIIGAQDGNGNDMTNNDFDSTPDSDPTNDGTPTDDVIDNSNGDEDDHDGAPIPVQVFDLAIRKTTTQTTPVTVGNDVPFTITVINQGSAAVRNVRIADYLPQFFTLSPNDTNGWTVSNDTLFTTMTNAIAAGDSAKVNVLLRVGTGLNYNGTARNFAEITDMQDENGNDRSDIDSTPDSNSTNDGTPSDDVVDNSNGDEDDHDFAEVPVLDRFDLALVKRLAPGQSSVVSPDDLVSFRITVYNQGNVTAKRVRINDYIPSGLELVDNNWTRIGNTAYYNLPIANLAPGESASVNITFRVLAQTNGLNITNLSEIKSADNDDDPNNAPPTDRDSTPDDDVTNDGTPINDSTTGGGDEDDHDSETITVEDPYFDLALRKTAANVTGPLAPGSPVTFNIVVHNQGTIPAYRVHLTDYIPSGLTLADSDWYSSVGEAATLIYPIPFIAAGDSVIVPITFMTNTNGCNPNICNRAEICGADMDTNPNNVPPVDIDSYADTNNSNDGYEADNELHNAGGDEDDSDVACISVDCEEGGGGSNTRFDLALRKRLSEGQATTVAAGDDVTFNIEVFNQGNVVAYNVNVTDYIPTGFILNDANWTQAGSKAYLNDPIATITPGSSVTRTIRFTVHPNFTGTSITNIAEIRNADNDTNPNNTPPTDADSYADTNPSNDIVFDEEINNNRGDEDDHDPATINVTPAPPAPTFDLALRKTLATGQTAAVAPGDNVNYAITVYNQGQATAFNVQVVDYIPAGMTVADANWTVSGTMATYNTPIATIAAGSAATINLTLKVNENFTGGTLTNIAEIKSADNDTNPSNTPPTDIDSTPDMNPNNDGTPTDNDINGTNGDEDDHDPATITVTPVGPNPCPSVTVNATATDAACGQANGNISVSLTGTPANATVSYAWSNGATSATLHNLTAGTYTVTATIVTGGQTCMYTRSVAVNSTNGPVATATATAQRCETLGSIALSISGGQAPYTVAYTGAAGTQTGTHNAGTVTLSNLTAGAYTIAITDANGCMTNLTANVADGNANSGLQLSATPTNPSACGVANGQIVLVANGGAPSYKFYLNGTLVSTQQGATYTATNLSAGMYSVYVEDTNGCESITANINLTEGTPQPINGWSVGNAACGATTGTIAYTGAGSAAVQYQLLSAGNTTPIATVSGNQPYSNNNLAAGTYTVRTVTTDGCASNLTLVIAGGATAINFDVNSTNAGCTSAQGMISVVNITGGTAPYTIAIRNAAGATVTGSSLPAGNYTVTVSTTDGCATTKNVTIQGAASITATAIITEQICEGGNTLGAATVNATGGTNYTYQWSNGATTQNITNITPGIYTVTVTAASGCSSTSSINLQAGNTTCVMPTVSTVNITNVTCGGANGAATIVISNPEDYEFIWSPNVGTTATAHDNGRTNLPAGRYQVVISDPCLPNCYTKIVINITNSGTAVTTPTVNTTAATCGMNNGTATLTPANYYYNWGNGVTGATRNGLAAGTYIVTVSAAQGNACTTTANVVIAQGGANFTATASIVSQPTCGQSNGAVNLLVNGGSGNFTYSWNGGDSRTNLAPGSYTVTITDQQSGCSNTVSFTLINVTDGCGTTGCISQRDSVTVAIQDCAAKGDVCLPIVLAQYNTYTVTVNGSAYAGQVKPCNIVNGAANGSMLELPIGTHTIAYTAPNAACPDYVIATIECNAQRQGNTNPTTAATQRCGTNKEVLVTITDCNTEAALCLNKTAQELNNLFITIDGVQYSNGYRPCDKTSQTVGLSLEVGLHTITLKQPATGCVDTLSVVVECDENALKANDDVRSTLVNKPVQIAVLDNDQLSEEGAIVTIVTQPRHGDLQEVGKGVYQYTPAKDFCDDKDEFTYQVTTPNTKATAKAIIAIECNSITVFSGMSPNGDGINDVFVIQGIEEYPANTVTIFNEKGAQIFFEKGYNNLKPWDGTFNGRFVEEGTYYYIVNDGKGNAYSGYLQIKR